MVVGVILGVVFVVSLDFSLVVEVVFYEVAFG